MKEAEENGGSPGSEALKRLFDACGPCLMLSDELVAYAKTRVSPGLPRPECARCARC
ncbi:MAG: hypothetical protein HFF18_12735 [Oscillospiraceae bacterium]|nr:hypothetical protein [Oscillospiraceae bacterium]